MTAGVLLSAAANSHTECAKLFLRYGANPNWKSADVSETLLMKAAKKGNLDLLQALSENGAEVNEIDSMGQSALIYARSAKAAECAEALLAAGAIDVDTDGAEDSPSSSSSESEASSSD